jgi:hypothetical protein
MICNSQALQANHQGPPTPEDSLRQLLRTPSQPATLEPPHAADEGPGVQVEPPVMIRSRPVASQVHRSQALRDIVSRALEILEEAEQDNWGSLQSAMRLSQPPNLAGMGYRLQ